MKKKPLPRRGVPSVALLLLVGSPVAWADSEHAVIDLYWPGFSTDEINAALAGGGVAPYGFRQSTRLGERAHAVDYSTALGYNANAQGTHALAVGNDAAALHKGSIALGNNAGAMSFNSIAIGSGALAMGQESIALGANSSTYGDRQVSVGSGGMRRKLVYVADGDVGADSSEAITGRQLHATQLRLGTVERTATSASTTANLALAAANATGGLISEVSSNGAVRIGGGNAGNVVDVRNRDGGTRRLQGLSNAALGARSSDAVTGQQLHASNQRLDTQGQTLLLHGQSLLGHDHQLLRLDHLVHDHERRISDNRRDIDDLRGDMDDFAPDLRRVLRFNDDHTEVDVQDAVIKRVAAGDISSADSSEGINGGQLFATNARIAAMESAARFIAVGNDEHSEAAHSGRQGVALGDSAQASEGGTAVGAFATAKGMNAVALGRGSFVEEAANDGFALGANTYVSAAGGMALGRQSRVEADATGSVAIGMGSIVDTADAVSFGNADLKRRVMNVARGTEAHDVVVLDQLGESLAQLGGGAGLDAAGRVRAPGYRVQGGSQHTVEDALLALDGAVIRQGAGIEGVEAQLRAVFQQGPDRRADGVGQVELTGSNGMVLGNVADGRVAAGSRDAVNGGQLHALQQRLDGRIDGLQDHMEELADAGKATVGQHAAARSDMPSALQGPLQPAGAGTALADAESSASPQAGTDAPTQLDTRQLDELLERANRYVDQGVAGLEQRLDRMDKRFSRMAAMNTAQAAMAMNTAGLATYNRLGAGIGTAEGEAAMAVGYQRVLNERGSSTLSLHGAFTNSGERGVGLGVGVGW